MVTKPDGARTLTLDIQADFSDRPADLPPIFAHVFSKGGALVAVQALDARGSAKFGIPTSREPEALRVVLGPELDKEQLELGELLRRGGVERHVALRPEVDRIAPLVFELGPDVYMHWLRRRCVVRGTLLKQIVSGGVTLRLPVCRARIDIYEVDPWPRIILDLPDLEIDRMREIIDGPWPPIDLPIPPRPPELDVGAVFEAPGSAVALNPQPLPPRGATLRANAVVPADLALASRAARPAFERALIANLEVIRPILCWLFPMRVTKQKIATVMTDECGHFRTVIWRSIFDLDQPDLYFVARQRIWPGFWVTILERTPVACHTWWNYLCGTEITLVTTHPAAHACPPCPPIVAPNNWVLFMAIGNTSVWRIHGANDATRIGTAGFDAAKHGLLDGTAPWGGTLRPRIEFDSSLRSSLGVRYYRVSYKRPTEAETEWRPSTEAISRHYTHEVGGDLILEQYPLGPVSVGGSSHLYEIPPALPPTGQWSIPNAVLDTQSAVFPTGSVSPGVGFDATGTPAGADQGGLWQIRVELFDAGGALVDPEGLGIRWRVPESTTLTGTIQTRDAATLGLVDAARNRMVVTVRVDNNPAWAGIGAPTLDGAPAGQACGVMSYGSRASVVAMPFVALQRARFATYSFRVKRGAEPGYEVSASGSAAASVAAMPAAPTATVDALLDACTIAGFSENLYVAHMATDGWSRQSQLDASDVRAFVLAPTTVMPG